MQAEPQVVKEGWLVKAPSPNSSWRFWDKHWKKRYFVLCSGQLPGEAHLVWYQDEQHRRNGKAKDKIFLHQCEQVDSNLSLSYERRNKKVSYTWIFDIRVNTAKGSLLYYFSAPSEQEMNEWVQVLCNVCHLEREDDTDVSNGNERSPIGTMRQHFRSDHDGMPSQTQYDRRYVEPPHSEATPSRVKVGTTNSRSESQQNGRALSPPQTQPGPGFISALDVVPPAPFIPRPPAPSPAAPVAVVKEEVKNSGLQSKIALGYIPLKECTSNPPPTIDNPAANSRLAGSIDQEQPVVDSSSLDAVGADQPPSFPAPPLPVDDIVFQQPQIITAPQQHSRSASKDSSVSSVHLSSNESEQGDHHRRPSVGKPSGAENNAVKSDATTALSADFGSLNSPNSPISPPAAVTYMRVGQVSNGSSVSYTTDDATAAVTPPPRPPKTRISGNSQTKLSYENEPSPIKDHDEMSGFSSYDKLTRVQRQVLTFDSLPRTTRDFTGTGRISRDSHSAFSTVTKTSVLTTCEQGFSYESVRQISLHASDHGNSVADPVHPPLASARPLHDNSMSEMRSRNVSSSSGLTDDTDLSYSPFTPGPPRLVPAPAAPVRPSRSPSAEQDGAGGDGDQYQNFIHPPRTATTPQRSPVPGQSVPRDKPPEVKRELKPGALKPNRSPATPTSSNGGIGPLPKVPNRLTDLRKGTAGGNVAGGNGNHYYTHANSEGSSDQNMPQFNVERQVSFKSQKRNMGRQQTAPGLMVAPGNRRGSGNMILDAEVKIEEAQLEYVFVDTTSVRVTATSPPGTPSAFPRKIRGVPSSPPSSASSSVDQGPNTKFLPSNPPGYIQIDPQATGALRLAQAESAAWRDSQQRTLERNKSQQQSPMVHHANSSIIGRKK